jgi:hypothetical protein
MRLLIARGGAPHPLWCYARVSDLTDKNAALMANAGVRAVFIGQESGDQQILQRMKKGTHVNQVRPAVAALAHNGIFSVFGFIHGFPGETKASIQATRDMICHINDDCSSNPSALSYSLYPFFYQDLASISQSEDGHSAAPWAYNQSIQPREIAEETLATFMAAARTASAPVRHRAFVSDIHDHDPLMSWVTHPRKLEMFRWHKAVELGITIFLEKDLEGKRPSLNELNGVREEILRPLVPGGWQESSLAATSLRKIRIAVLRRLAKEFEAEANSSPGSLTRLMLAAAALQDSGSLKTVIARLRSIDSAGAEPREKEELVDVLAKDLIRDATIESPKQWREKRKRERMVASG